MASENRVRTKSGAFFQRISSRECRVIWRGISDLRRADRYSEYGTKERRPANTGLTDSVRLLIDKAQSDNVPGHFSIWQGLR